MKPRVAFLALMFAHLSLAAENSSFYLAIRNNDLSTLSKLIRDPGPKTRDSRGTAGVVTDVRYCYTSCLPHSDLWSSAAADRRTLFPKTSHQGAGRLEPRDLIPSISFERWQIFGIAVPSV